LCDAFGDVENRGNEIHAIVPTDRVPFSVLTHIVFVRIDSSAIDVDVFEKHLKVVSHYPDGIDILFHATVFIIVEDETIDDVSVEGGLAVNVAFLSLMFLNEIDDILIHFIEIGDADCGLFHNACFLITLQR
jgi:hypothetical protein